MDITADPVAVPTPRIAAPIGAAGARAVSLAWAACRGAAAQSRWEQLAACASEPNPFFEPWYLLPSLTALDPAGRVELLVVEAGGEWLGLLPLARRANYYRYPVPHLQGWLHANAFLGAPLVTRGREAEVWQALLEHADREARAGLFLHLPGLPLGGPLLGALVGPLLGASLGELVAELGPGRRDAPGGLEPAPGRGALAILGRSLQVGLAVVSGMLVSRLAQMLLALVGVVGFVLLSLWGPAAG